MTVFVITTQSFGPCWEPGPTSIVAVCSSPEKVEEFFARRANIARDDYQVTEVDVDAFE